MIKISYLKKVLFKRALRISKINTKSELRSLYFTSIFSLFLIGFSFLLPPTVNYLSNSLKKPKTFENYSKKYLEKVLSGEELVSESSLDDELDPRHLVDDIEFKKGPSKSVRIEASTLNQMFEDKDYTLDLVRAEKIVKPFEVGMLPVELKQIQSSKERKN